MSGYTVFLCAATGCGAGDDGSTAAFASRTLRAAVGASSHGVLVVTTCLCGGQLCTARARAPLALMQPCDEQRRPTACAVLVGPLRTDEDAAALGGWLGTAELDARLLPPHLLELHTRLTAYPRR